MLIIMTRKMINNKVGLVNDIILSAQFECVRLLIAINVDCYQSSFMLLAALTSSS